MIKAVIFDLDGTLTEFNLNVKACRLEVIEALSEHGLPKEHFSLNESAFSMLPKVKRYLGPKSSNKKIVEIKKMIYSIVESHELQAAKKTSLFSGASEALMELKEMGMKIGLCTISGEKASGYILKKFKIKHFFDAIFPRESVSYVKPHPEHLQAVMDELKSNSDETTFVGDSIKDVICAKHLNVLAVGVTTGLSSYQQLSSSGAHYIISSITEIPKLIHQLKNM